MSLATVGVDEHVEIVRVLLRSEVHTDPYHHLRPGRRWRCRFAGSATMLLVGRQGETISISRDVARYVEVRRVPERDRHARR